MAASSSLTDPERVSRDEARMVDVTGLIETVGGEPETAVNIASLSGTALLLSHFCTLGRNMYVEPAVRLDPATLTERLVAEIKVCERVPLHGT